ncbi:peptide ABC transporter substrate-binding protein [Lignipirellula cremea]|nr:peptide ABC transporter substrate-binding protein [Lignipirellula cremea]
MSHHLGRTLFPYLALAGAIASIGWAMSFAQRPPADFTFNNGDEVKTLDPPKSTGQPEGRILRSLFEGLLSERPPAGAKPDASGNLEMTPQPAAASAYTISEDGRTYTFTMRQGAKWSNGDPVTADDFVFSWRRMLHPYTGSQYAYQLYYIEGAEDFTNSKIEVGSRVEIEIDAPGPSPKPTIHGVVLKILKPAQPKYEKYSDKAKEEKAKEKSEADWKERFVYQISVKPQTKQGVDWEAPGKTVAYTKAQPGAELPVEGPVERCTFILLDFDTLVGIRAPNPETLVVTLKEPTPYFANLVAFYPLFPVNRRCVEAHGDHWTDVDKIVTNGPYLLQGRRIRDHIRMVKNPTYWDAENVQVEVVDALPVQSETTSLNMYLNDQLDWTTTVPLAVLPKLKTREDFYASPMLGTYFYRVNVTKAPFNNREKVEFDGEQVEKGVLIRRALNASINKQQIVDYVTRAGQPPSRTFTPPVLPGYDPPQCGEYDLALAKRMLKAAGFDGGSGLPKLELLFNTADSHRSVAEVIQRNWAQIGVQAQLRNVEWAQYLALVQSKDYSIARAGWIGDYPDPMTFLDMFVTDGANNETGWSNPEYDRLIASAKSEPDTKKRLQMLYDAERILMDELPVIPLYTYVTINMVKPYVKGFAPHNQDTHPLPLIWIEK